MLRGQATGVTADDLAAAVARDVDVDLDAGKRRSGARRVRPHVARNRPAGSARSGPKIKWPLGGEKSVSWKIGVLIGRRD